LGIILKNRFTLNGVEWASKVRSPATDTNHSPSNSRRIGSRVDNQIQEHEDLEEEVDVRKRDGGSVELYPRVLAVLVDPRPDPYSSHRHSNDGANCSRRVRRARLDIRSPLRRCIVSGRISHGSSGSWSGYSVCASRQRRRTPGGRRADFRRGSSAYGELVSSHLAR
jgi:hypothetical protein